MLKPPQNNADYFTITECIDIITKAAALRDGIKFNVNYYVSLAIARQIARKEKYLVNESDIDSIVRKTIATLANHGVTACQLTIKKMLHRNVAKSRETQRKLKTITDKTAFDLVKNMDGLTPDEVANRMTCLNILDKVMIFENASMGGNKTNRYIEFSKGKKGGVLVITALVAICKDLIERFNKAGTDILDYQGLSAEFLAAFRYELNAVFCINSITKSDITDNFKHIFIDEAVAVFDSIFDDKGTNAKQQKQLVSVLRVIFVNVDSIVIADAALANKHVAFFKSLCPKKRTILLETTPLPSTTNYHLLENHSHSHEFILRDVLAGKSGVVATDTVGNAKAVEKYLKITALIIESILRVGLNKRGQSSTRFLSMLGTARV